MRSCTRCGIKLQHNYLLQAFMTSGEKRERVLVCSKCKGILDIKDKQQPAPKEKQVAPKEKQRAAKENQPATKPAQAEAAEPQKKL